MTWKAYPYRIGDDPELTFPAAEGDQGAESNTYYVAGRLRGRATGHEWAFLVIFAYNDVRHWLRADFYTFALFDLATGEYGTYSEFDLPSPARWRRAYKLQVAPGRLDVSFASACGSNVWTTRRGADGALIPFSYRVALHGRDAAGRPMQLDLDLETHKPPLPVGGPELGGVKTCMGQYGTHSYFQSDVRFHGELAWGSAHEEVDGDCGWIDRQWTPRYLGVYSDRKGSRYRHEWRQLHLDNGTEMSVWLHYDRPRGNRLIPFSGATAAAPDHEVLATTEVSVDRLSFVRDPELVKPRYALSKGAKYFADRYRLRIPAWDLDLISEPLVAAPAHQLPIEYWSGPTRMSGTMGTARVRGFGFHERTRAFCRDFELVEVLRQSVRHQPESAFPADSPGALALANQVWEVDAFLSHRDRAGARRYLEQRVLPQIERLDADARRHLLRILVDLETALAR